MKKLRLLALALSWVVLLPAVLMARDISPVVSADWLEKNLTKPDLKVVDIRKPDEYRSGHIPGAVNVPYGTLAVKAADLDNELPADDALLDIVNSVGLTPKSLIVIAGKVDGPSEQTNNTRIAWTLKYAGFDNVAVLDGGYNRWVADGKPMSVGAVVPKTASSRLKLRKYLKAEKGYVLEKLEKATLVDARLPEFFFGAAKLPFVEKAGHINGAVNLPSAWIFTKEGNFKPVDELKAMAEGVVGRDRDREIITYCDTGRLASAWWFVLSEMLNYKDVKVYDGSSQEFTRDPRVPMEKFTWK